MSRPTKPISSSVTKRKCFLHLLRFFQSPQDHKLKSTTVTHCATVMQLRHRHHCALMPLSPLRTMPPSLSPLRTSQPPPSPRHTSPPSPPHTTSSSLPHSTPLLLSPPCTLHHRHHHRHHCALRHYHRHRRTLRHRRCRALRHGHCHHCAFTPPSPLCTYATVNVTIVQLTPNCTCVLPPCSVALSWMFQTWWLESQ